MIHTLWSWIPTRLVILIIGSYYRSHINPVPQINSIIILKCHIPNISCIHMHIYPTYLSLPLLIYINSTLPIYDPLPYLPLTTETPCPITYEQTHQFPPLNATLRLIISPLPSLPLNNSLPRTADC